MRYFFIKNLKKLYGSFLWIGFNYLKAAEPLRGDSLFLKTKSPRLLVTNIGLGRLENLFKWNLWKQIPPCNQVSIKVEYRMEHLINMMHEVIHVKGISFHACQGTF